MKMIAGLGNPGSSYAKNRHNLGFLAIDRFVETHHLNGFKEQKQALTLKARLLLPSPQPHHQGGGSGEFLLVKPLTYMNLSGNAIHQLMVFYKIPAADILVVSEDIYLSFGVIKIRPRGGTGGHNGLKSIHKHLGEDYPRLRFGVGYDDRIPLEQYVLSDFPPADKEPLSQSLDIIVRVMEDFIYHMPLAEIMAKYNGSDNGIGGK